MKNLKYVSLVGMVVAGSAQVSSAQLPGKGGVSSGTPPTFMEVQCVSADGKVTVTVQRDFAKDPDATIVAPAGMRSGIKLKKTNSSGEGTPAEKPLTYKGKNFKLELFITALPINGENPIVRSGHVRAKVKGQTVDERFDECRIFQL
jgi:hypothetical protein